MFVEAGGVVHRRFYSILLLDGAQQRGWGTSTKRGNNNPRRLIDIDRPHAPIGSISLADMVPCREYVVAWVTWVTTGAWGERV
jgi:hypothetical protein